MQFSFEIGVVYRKGNRHFLAVAANTLIGFRNGGCYEVRPQVKYDAVRTISVEELCNRWGITLTEMDKTTAKYLAPPVENLKTRPRGSRRQRQADEQAWRRMRLIRMARAG